MLFCLRTIENVFEMTPLEILLSIGFVLTEEKYVPLARAGLLFPAPLSTIPHIPEFLFLIDFRRH